MEDPPLLTSKPRGAEAADHASNYPEFGRIK